MNIPFSSPTRTELSPSLLKSWDQCRKQYYYKTVRGLRWPSENTFSLGTTVHKLMDYQSRGYDELPVFETMLAAAPSDIQAHWHLLAKHPIVHWEVLGNEWGFQVPLGVSPLERGAEAGRGNTFWLSGRIDRVARDTTGKIWVIDWKTGTGVPQNYESAWQTLAYCYATVLAASDLGLVGLLPEQLGFIYVSVKTAIKSPFQEPGIQLYTVNYTDQLHQHTRDRLATLTRQLGHADQQQDYPLPETCPDRFCCYRPICGI